MASAAGAAQQIADARFRVSAGLFLTLSLVIRLRTELQIPPPELVKLSTSVYTIVTRMTRLYYAFSWLVIQPFNANSRYAPVESQFVNLSLGQSQPLTLVEGYVRSVLFVIPPSEAHDASHTVSQVGLQVCSSLDIDTSADSPFLDFLVKNEQWATIEKLVQRLKGLQPDPERGRGVVLESRLLADLKGCALLHMGKYEDASETLANVAACIADDEGIAIRVIGDHYMSEGMNTLPSQRGQALCPEALKWFYCLRIALMFESHRQFHYAEKFYMAALPPVNSDPHNTAAIREEVAAIAWSCIFQARLISEPPQYEAAYQAITAFPNFPLSAKSQDAVKSLVSLLCESGKEGVKALHAIHFETKVVRAIASHILSKARIADIPSDLSNPLNYYTVLYSFLITRENYREAAKCMYEYGQRIPTVQPKEKDPSSPSSYLSHTSPHNKRRAPLNPYFYQSQAYLIAITALKIVSDSDFQWIEVDSEKTQTTTKRKRDTSPSVTATTVVTLSDIEKAYTLATAHAFLWTTANNNPKQGLLIRGAGPNVQDTYTMLVTAENYKLALDFAHRFSLDPKLVLEALAERCGKDAQFAVTAGWNLLKRWLDAHDTVITRNNISPTRLQEIISRQAQDAHNRAESESEFESESIAGTVYPLVGILAERIIRRNELDPNEDSKYFARLADLKTSIEVRVRAPISSSVRIGQPVLIYIKLIYGEAQSHDVNAMDDDQTTNGHATPHAVRVVTLRQNTFHAYHSLVAEKLLATNPRIVLPMWLARWFSDSEFSYPELLQIYLSNHRLEDACFVAIDIIEKAARQLSEGAPALLPYTLFDNLYGALEDKESKTRLNNGLINYFSILDKVRPQSVM